MNGGNAPIVLIVDDERMILDFCKEYLEEDGYCVLVAPSAADALKQLRGRAVEAVFLDIIMPDMDGIEALREIKRSYPHLRVFVMSGGGRGGFTGLDFLGMAMKFGADGMLKKPFGGEDLRRLLKAPAAVAG